MKRILKILDSFERFFATCLFVVMCVAVLAQMLFRIVLKDPLLVSEEVARFSYVWVVFLCMSLGERDLDHFHVDAFVGFLRGKADTALRVLENLIGLALFVYLFYWSARFVGFMRIIKSAAMEISMAWVASALCVGFGLCVIRRGVNTWRNIRLLFAGKSSGVM